MISLASSIMLVTNRRSPNMCWLAALHIMELITDESPAPSTPSRLACLPTRDLTAISLEILTAGSPVPVPAPEHAAEPGSKGKGLGWGSFHGIVTLGLQLVLESDWILGPNPKPGGVIEKMRMHISCLPFVNPHMCLMRNKRADSEDPAPEVRVCHWRTEEDFILAQRTTVLCVNRRRLQFPML